MISRGQYSAFDLERSRLNPAFRPNLFVPTAGDYLSATAAYGSVGLPPNELAGAPELVRASADRTLVAALGLQLKPAPAPRTGSCRREPLSFELELPGGAGAWFEGDRLGEATFTLRRFATVPSARLTPEASAGSAALRMPRDGAGLPWRLRVTSDNLVTVCRVPSS
jgi:hypothetical protein